MEPVHKDFFPGYGLIKPVQPTPYECPSDDVYNTEPIAVYGNMPADDMELRGNAEFIHASSDLTKTIGRYVCRVSEILSGMSVASINDENIEKLKAIVTDGYERIINLLNSMDFGGQYDEYDG